MRPVIPSIPRGLLSGALAFAIMCLPVVVGAGPRVPLVAGVDRALAADLKAGSEEIDVIVQFAKPPGSSELALLTQAGMIPPFIRYQVVPAVSASGSAAAIKRLAMSPLVTFIEKDVKIPYALDRAAKAGRAKGVWDATYRVASQLHTEGITGRGIGIAIVDSGVDASHPDLIWKPLAEASGATPKTTLNLKILGRDSIGLSEIVPPVGDFFEASVTGVDMADTDTTGGHGTHVAGIAAGNGAASGGKFKGAAPGANLIGFGAGETLVVSSGLAAFDWIHLHHREQNIRIINNSWGGAGDWNPESTITKAVRRLVNEHRIAVVFAAGNSGGDGTELETSVWGNIPEVIQVANYYDRRGWLDDSSSRGKRDLESTWPDLAAPGTEVIATAAQGKPVAVYGTAQDAAINIGFGYGEPNVVPAPLPAPVETEVAGHDVLVGNYASFTGTSMSSPFVSGVIALILEANPDLTPFQVKDILRETADMPAGRTYENDGFAVGKGVVDAGEAVAVALRMRDGLGFAEALRLAYVDRSSDSWKINTELPRRVDGLTVNATSTNLGVAGQLVDGSTTDQRIPMGPSTLPRLSGETIVRHFGVFGFPTIYGPYRTAVVPGESVRLQTRDIVSNDAALVVSPSWEGSFVITKGGTVRYGPLPAKVTGQAALVMESPWQVPMDIEPGEYRIESRLKNPQTSDLVLVDSVAMPVASPREPEPESSSNKKPAAAPAVPGPWIQGAVFSEDFESEPEGWTVDQNGVGPGVLTSWTWIDADSALIADPPHSGKGHYYAGHAPGSELVNGLYYEDLADVSLISPPISIPAGEQAQLSYWRWGSSEKDYDFLTVYVAADGSNNWTEIDKVAGDIINGGAPDAYENKVVSIAGFSGTNIRLRFRFSSDETTGGANVFGWFIDDVVVSSIGAATGPKPRLFVTDPSGIGSLDTGFVLGHEGSIDRMELDFGDGSPVFSVTQTASVGHRYGPGRWTARLRTFKDQLSATTTQVIDVAPLGVTQVRLPGQQWVTAAGGTSFTAAISGAFSGVVSVEARHCLSSGCVYSTAQGSVPVLAAAPSAPAPIPKAKKPSEPAPEAVSSSPAPAAAPVAEQPSPSPAAPDEVTEAKERSDPAIVKGTSKVAGLAAVAGALLCLAVALTFLIKRFR